MVDLCRVWADLSADPDNPTVAAAARANIAGLVFHVPFCDACASVSESMPDPQKVLHALGDLDASSLSAEDRAEIRAINASVLGDDEELSPADVLERLAALEDSKAPTSTMPNILSYLRGERKKARASAANSEAPAHPLEKPGKA
jgi:hypothetical protein